jgi:ferrochelatase
VRRYLREFLGDPRVLDMNPVARALLLNLVILPFRPRASAEAYAKIWTERGSPLRVHGEELERALSERLGPSWRVALAMRYGAPSLADGMEALAAAGVTRVVVLPLYPQYASSSTGSTLEAVYRRAAAREVVPALAVVPPFHDEPGFLDAFAAVAAPVVERERPDHVLVSFHGLPERQVRRADPTGAHCLRTATCCDAPSPANPTCYRAACFATARALAARLALPDGKWSVAFQSRLGRTPWLRPYADHALVELARAGARRVAVLCPAFVADCLETLEEMGIRGRRSFLDAGGESLALVPSLNATPAWVEAAAALARRAAGEQP